MFYDEIGQQVLDENGYEDWEVVDDSIIVSPLGHEIEWDGVSPDGEVSPFRILGFI